MKRWRPRARGRVARIRKRTCHITIELAPIGGGCAARGPQRSRPGGAEPGADPGRPAADEPRPQAPEAEQAAEAPAEEKPKRRSRAKKTEETQAEAAPAEEKPKRTRNEEDRGEGGVVGQKVHPGGLRVGVIHDWKSNWYTGTKEFADYLLEDIRIREHIYSKLSHAGLSDILIRKDKQRITIDIYTARPGIVIGKSGVEVDALRREVHAMTQKNVHININEIKRPELDAKLVAQSIAEQLENRVSFRRAMKRSLASAMRSGAHGVKISLRRPPRRRRDEPLRDVLRRAASRCTRSAPTSTTASSRRRRPSAGSA